MKNRKLTNLKKRLNRIKKGRRYHSANNRRLKKIALAKTIAKQSCRCELYDAIAFLYPQTKHSLIPQNKSAEDDLELAKERKSFRQELFILFGEKIKEISANYSASDNSEKNYRHIRYELDSIPEIQAVHQRRIELQERLWKRVAMDIENDRDRLSSTFESHFKVKNKGKLELNSELNYPRHQLNVDVHRMPGGYLKDSHESEERK